MRKRPFVVLSNRKSRRVDFGLDMALSDIIENPGSTNSALVFMPAVIDELVIPAVCSGDPSGLRQTRGSRRVSIFEFIDSGFPPAWK